ncbi:uncharacterized protein A4U43_C09F16090 [Asparagus officinalis]|uniref:RING-type E3 ubiquitin transferase n=1 Tax=Asparagus officinalis TaxID=4686 RepID=A0A5P1E7S2_ASPOF|nr:uncharacterized protein A4U43_C09F16090 [Asparagus officinalis]
MKDPVVLASGQTYDRPFIQEWLNSGNRTCPQTQQVLTNPTLTPNHLVRSMISQWCMEHNIPLPPPSPISNPDDPPISASERTSVSSLLKNLSSPSLPIKKQAVKDLRLLTKQKTSVRAFIGQNPEVIPKLISVFDGVDHEIHEDTVTTMLNVSLFESNKKVLGDDPQTIPFLIDALKTGTMQTRGNSAAALFSLSALDSNKIKIGELGAMRPLISLLEHGSLQAKKDAANAIFNLCTNHENRTRAVSDGVAGAVLLLIMDKLLVGESLAILALVSGHKELWRLTELDTCSRS